MARLWTTLLVSAVLAAPAAAAGSSDTTIGLAATAQLAAMHKAIAAAPQFFAGRTTGCAATTPLLTSQSGSIMAGNFRDGDGNCYVWLNLEQSEALTGSEICKVTLHELGHLTGLQHSTDPADVMYSPFQATPIPPPCAPAPPAKVKPARRVCPPGTGSRDYCEAHARARRTRR